MKDSILPSSDLSTNSNTTFFYFLVSNGLRKSTIRNYVSVCEKVYYDKPQALNSVDCANEYISQLVENRNGATNVYYYALKKWFRYAKGKNKAKKLVKPNVNFKKTNPNYLPIKQLVSRINNINEDHYRLCALVMLFGGARVSEVLNIKYKNININENDIQITVEKAKTDPYLIYINKENFLFSELIDYFNQNDFVGNDHVFCQNVNLHSDSTHHTFIETNRKYFAKILKEKVGIRTHDLKRNLAKMLRDNDIDVLKIKKLLHHKRIDTTKIYLEEVSEKEASKERDLLLTN